MTKVLITDNSPVYTRLLSHFFIREGCETFIANNGLAAMNILDSTNVDILFTDIIMPKIGGEQLCKMVRQATTIKDIFIVVFSSVIIERNNLDLDADVYIAKGPKTAIQDHVRNVLDLFQKGESRRNEIIGSQGLYQREITKEFLQAKKYYRTVFDTITDAVLEVSPDNQIVQANKSAQVLLNKNLETLLATGFTDYVSGTEVREIKKWLSRLNKNESSRFVSSYSTPLSIGSKQVVLNLVSTPYEDSVLIIAILRDITVQKRVEEKLALTLEKVKEQANFDALTGLSNLRLAREQLSTAIAIASRKKWKVALLFVDLDGLKKVNDTFGHPTGDKLLKEVAQRLLGSLRKADIVARIGGDEFLVVQSEVMKKVDAARVADKIVTSIQNPFHLDGYKVFISASVGISTYPDDGDKPTQLLKKADEAMYSIKFSGKNGFMFA